MSERYKVDPSKPIMLRLSGEALTDNKEKIFTKSAFDRLCEQVVPVYRRFPGLMLVVMAGGGEIIRGSELISEFKIPNDDEEMQMYCHNIGMLSTMISGFGLVIALKRKLEAMNIDLRVVSAFEVRRLCEAYAPLRVRRHLSKGRLILLVGGSGEGFKSSDEAALTKAAETGCKIILKGTKEDGVFAKNPKDFPGEKFTPIPTMSVREFQERGITGIFDAPGVAKVAEKPYIPIRIFNFFTPGTLLNVLAGQEIGTLIHP